MRSLLRTTGTFWMKDDHDHRFNDCDTTGERAPSSELGIRTFREQVPIVAMDDETSPTWRRVRFSRHLEVWMTEGRDHRSPNRATDGPEKTLWGEEQTVSRCRTIPNKQITTMTLLATDH